MRKNNLGLIFVVDIFLSGVCLCVFALFHHVLPKNYESNNEKIDSNENISSDLSVNKYFSNEIIATDNSYTSNNIALNIKTVDTIINNKKVVYYEVDVRIKDINSLQTVFAQDKFGRGYAEAMLDIDERSNALFTVNGDYYGNSRTSIVLRNGILYRDSIDEDDICVLYHDGVMETYTAEEFDLEKVKSREPYQIWTFGPALLDSNSKAITKFSGYGTIVGNNPRSSIGYYEPGHYVFIVVNGRTSASSGLTLKELAQVYESLGCKAAYNLDGGKSSVMTFNDKIYNKAIGGGRKSSDAIIIKEIEYEKN